MSDTRGEQRLQLLVRREGRTLLQYLNESYPWTASGDADRAAFVRRAASYESDALAAVVRLMQKKRVRTPYFGSYLEGFTDLNFIGLRAVWPRLIAAQKQDIATLERDLADIDDADFHAVVTTLLERKRRHLQEMVTPAAPAAASA